MSAVPSVSFLLPVYNGQEFLAQAMDSVLAQTWTDFEVLCFDDGSTDRTLEILQQYAQKDARVRVISRPNKGLIATLNEGIDLASGTWIARMDADDLCHPMRLAQQVEWATAQGADLCGCHFEIRTHTGTLREVFAVPVDSDGFHLFFPFAAPIAHGSALIRKEFLLSNGLRYGQAGRAYAEDHCLWTRMALAGARCVNVDSILFTYRDTAASLSKTRQKQVWKDSKDLAKVYLQHFQKEYLQAMSSKLPQLRQLSIREQEVAVTGILYGAVHFGQWSWLKYLRNASLWPLIKGIVVFRRF